LLEQILTPSLQRSELLAAGKEWLGNNVDRAGEAVSGFCLAESRFNDFGWTLSDQSQIAKAK